MTATLVYAWLGTDTGPLLQVLIFSQFKIMLDVIEDSLNLCKYPYERIDGSVSSRERQAAIDRFTKGAHSLKTLCHCPALAA